MRLQRIRAVNYRVFGDGKTAAALDWELNPGMNILVGENDAGKSAIVDAIRQVLLTTSYESVRLSEDDFHLSARGRTDELTVEATLESLTPEQEGSVLEWLTYEPDGSRLLVVHLLAKLSPPTTKRRSRVSVLVHSGRDGVGPEIGSAVRELVRATYLRPLRDAVAELSPGRNSRLSQILRAHESITIQGTSDFDRTAPTTVPKSLVGLMEHAQHHIGEHEAIKAVQKDINENYLSHVAFTGDDLSSDIRMMGNLTLSSILERFELSLLPPPSMPQTERCPRGLGYNNALFMATEMVLLSGSEELALLLVEEPEAHLHPQLQVRVMEFLQQRTQQGTAREVQVVMTTHSPTLAAGASIESMTLVQNGSTFRLRPEETRLVKADYDFLRRFIDATKSNLFFARGVVIVEGPAEALLLPAIAEMAEVSFSGHGISVVNVGNVGLYHYARVLQRSAAGQQIPIPVACITDRDIVPDCASYVGKPSKGKRFESDYGDADAAETVRRKIDRVESSSDPNVKVFVSDYWTLEYDLARSGLAQVIFLAIVLAMKAKTKGERLTAEDEVAALVAAKKEWANNGETDLEKRAVAIYQPLYENDASKAVAAEYAAKLLRSGDYGTGASLLNKLPPYLKSALQHLTTPAGSSTADA